MQYLIVRIMFRSPAAAPRRWPAAGRRPPAGGRPPARTRWAPWFQGPMDAVSPPWAPRAPQWPNGTMNGPPGAPQAPWYNNNGQINYMSQVC